MPRQSRSPRSAGVPAEVQRATPISHGVTCGCGAHDPDRKALGVDPDIKSSNLMRLRRIEGQVRGLQKMVEEDRYCADILTQISSVQEALRGVSRELLRNHLRHCVTDTLKQAEPRSAEAMFDELVTLFDRQRS